MNFGFEKDKTLNSMVQRLNKLVCFLLEIIKQKDKQLQAKYKLVDWIEKKGIGYCKVHFVGTAVVNNYTPGAIVADDKFISGFSHLDIRTITNLANYEKYKPKNSINSINYEEKVAEIKNIDNSKSCLPIDSNIYEEIEQFSKKDVFNLGRIVGEMDTQI